MTSFDVVVIGAGPAGYHAAIRAAQLGLKTACVDAFAGKDGKSALGGACVNVGCVPSRVLLDSSRQLYDIGHNLSAHGIIVDSARIELDTFIGRKDKIVTQFTSDVAKLLKANNISSYFGKGKLLKDNRVKISGNDGAKQIIGAINVILASGSVPIELPFSKFDGERIIDSTGALELTDVPRRLGVIGAGAIGLELGSVWSRLGSKVTILEVQPIFLEAADADIAKIAQKEFIKQGLTIRLGARMVRAEVKGKEVHITYEDKGGTHELVVDKLLVAVGRRAYTEGLLSRDCGVKLDARGRIVVDEHCHTGVDGVWAIGDAVRGPMLAHRGFDEGIAVAEWIAGKTGRVDYETTPQVIYTDPEIAWVGKTERQLKEEGVPYKVGTFPLAGVGRALMTNEAVGQVKVLAHAQTDRILGVHMAGSRVSEVLAEAWAPWSSVGPRKTWPTSLKPYRRCQQPRTRPPFASKSGRFTRTTHEVRSVLVELLLRDLNARRMIRALRTA